MCIVNFFFLSLRSLKKLEQIQTFEKKKHIKIAKL